MADLRGQQLKDSYQDVVTRGSGNKLENGNGVEFADLDDKASLSDAFSTGSDSNSEWWKFHLTEHTGFIIAVKTFSTGGNWSSIGDESGHVWLSTQETISFPVTIDSVLWAGVNATNAPSNVWGNSPKTSIANQRWEEVRLATDRDRGTDEYNAKVILFGTFDDTP